MGSNDNYEVTTPRATLKAAHRGARDYLHSSWSGGDRRTTMRARWPCWPTPAIC